MLTARCLDVAKYRWEKDPIGPGSEEIMRLTAAFAGEVCWLLWIVHAREEDICADVFMADDAT